MSCKTNRGFTIIELMIVVAIVAILGALAAPSFRGTIASTRIKTAATDIHLSLARARSEAIKRNTNITVAASDDGWIAGWTVSNDVESHGAVSETDVTITGTASITYTPSGRVTSTPVEIELSSAATSTKRCVTVTLSGHPVIIDGVCP